MMDPYATPEERKVGAQRPKIMHVPRASDSRTKRERQMEKQGVAAERRAIKKAARRHLQQQLLQELQENER
jgi:hypothetical protein